ncbi:gfo/Idh/MocA family oxidoreductase [Halobacteriales archaeon QH_6_64_20]|nr:MAG: gfo/Idh/MocA family oxidoreductase [Halobacteriales archaeon QH_6_64_20]
MPPRSTPRHLAAAATPTPIRPGKSTERSSALPRKRDRANERLSPANASRTNGWTTERRTRRRWEEQVTPSRSDPLRVGLIGTGYIGNVLGTQFHAHPSGAVVALCDPNDEARAESADRYAVPAESRYAGYEAMLDGEAGELDAIVVGSPHAFHHAQILAGLDRDLHVFCDKPLTTDLAEAREIARRTNESDSTTMIGYQRHLNPAFIHARERWHGASSPQVRSITASITQNWISRFSGTWRTDPDLSGGGNLYDTGSHLLDAVLWTSGLTPTRVSADMDFADDEDRVDERANVLVRFAEGATADVSVFSDAPCVREHIHAWDEEGAIYLEGREWEPRTLTEISADSTDHTPYIDRDDQQSKADAFIESIDEGTEPPATVEDALRVTAVTEAAYESARSGDWVDIGLG